MTKQRGFTLIELLVVIAIIGILSSVVLASLNSARVKARDARRVTDIKQLQIAVELYYDAKGFYPSADTIANSLLLLKGSVEGASLPSIPQDPSGGGDYRYAYKGAAGAATAYHLGADIEQATGATTLDDADTDLNSSTWVPTVGLGGFDASKTADDEVASQPKWIYDVSNVGAP